MYSSKAFQKVSFAMQIAIKLSNYYKIEKRSQHFISWKCASNLLSNFKFSFHSQRFFAVVLMCETFSFRSKSFCHFRWADSETKSWKWKANIFREQLAIIPTAELKEAMEKFSESVDEYLFQNFIMNAASRLLTGLRFNKTHKSQ